MTATFFALARFYIPARAEYSQLTFCHRRFGSESLVGAKAPTLVLWCTVHQAAHIHQDTFVLGLTPLYYMKTPTITERRSESEHVS